MEKYRHSTDFFIPQKNRYKLEKVDLMIIDTPFIPNFHPETFKSPYLLREKGQ